jgi:signal transduction histidine kinase
MKKLAVITLALVVCICFAGITFADVEADKKTCVAKCEAAVKMIKEKGLEATIAEINKKDGPFVAGDIYVFAQKMDGTMAAHPIRADLIGKNQMDLKDETGKEFIKEFVKVVKEKGSGWVDYMWPKKAGEKPSAKTTYVLKVDDKTFVGAGVYK